MRNLKIKNKLLILSSSLFIVSCLVIYFYFSNCNPGAEGNKRNYQDITGHWKEYILKDGEKKETALRKIIVNFKGKLEQSIIMN